MVKECDSYKQEQLKRRHLDDTIMTDNPDKVFSDSVVEHRKLLTNLSLIRPILLVLLVFYHAFAIYSGAWDPIEGYPEVPVC